MGEVNESVVESILNEIGVEDPDFASLEAALTKSRQNLADATLAVENAQKALDKAKEEPNVRELARVKVEGMLRLDFDQQAVVDALRIQYPQKKTSNAPKNDGIPLDENTRQEIRDYVLGLTGSFKTTDIWERFANFKRSDVYSTVIAPLVKQGKVVKRGEKRGVHYYVAEHAPPEESAA